jgi:hypothetical protein
MTVNGFVADCDGHWLFCGLIRIVDGGLAVER